MINRLVEYHIARLEDKSPAVRLKSIRELALLGDKAALPALEQVYRNDEDPEVRRAAQEAGKAIFFRQRAEPDR
ncbi:MAG: HEAT repeat domain-containing protein [Anaerolineae bacterium]|nr:HEAT repeat domain-containing protein [Anaerolineae bacterium]